MKSKNIKKAHEEDLDLITSLCEHIDTVDKIKSDKPLQRKMVLIANVITECYKCGGRVLLAGNGGSASDAQHIATELISKFYFNRPALDAECLAGNIATLTAIGNDYSFDTIFSRQIEGKAKENDVFIGITTSGQSKNIIHALVAAKKQNAITVAFLGENNHSDITNHSDYIINVPSGITPRIQECHILIGHIICEMVEKNLFGEEYEIH